MTSPQQSTILRVAADLTSLAQVRAALDAALDGSDWPEEDSSRLMLAAGEAVCNAIEHGSVASGEVQVEIRTFDDGLSLVVTDDGNPEQPPQLDLAAAPPPAHSVRGRGLMIMRELADEIIIEPHGRGTRVRLRFDRGSEAAQTRDHRAA